MAWRRWSWQVVLAMAVLSCGSKVETQSGGGAPMCSADADCDDENPCTADSCGADRTCVHEAAPLDGTALPDKTPGDCQKIACHQGAAEMVPDDDDLPAPKPCSLAGCNGGVPSQTALPDGTKCELGVCDHGKCIAKDCDCVPPGPCQVLLPCDESTGCVYEYLPDGAPSPSGNDVSGDCQALVCIGGQETAMPMPAGVSCATYLGDQMGLCDDTGACVQCLQDGDCAANLHCVANACQ